MQCEFCKVLLKRKELKNDHTCGAIYPFKKFAIKPMMVMNEYMYPKDILSMIKCFFCKNYLRRAQ